MDDRSYYARRALQEREAARTAACRAARERHASLAEAYALRSGMSATEAAEAALGGVRTIMA